LAPIALISGRVAKQLWLPKRGMCLRNSGAFATIMAVPEATVNK